MYNELLLIAHFRKKNIETINSIRDIAYVRSTNSAAELSQCALFTCHCIIIICQLDC